MFFPLFIKEIKYQLKNITLYIFLGIVILFYTSQFNGDINQIKKPVPGQQYYGSTVLTEDKDIIGRIYSLIKSDIERGEYLKYGLMINKKVKLSEKDKAALTRAAYKISPEGYINNELKIKVSYYEFIKILDALDKDLGGSTGYGSKYRKMNFTRPMTYEEALKEYEDILSRDKLTNAYGRLFGDYMSITAGLFPVFLAAFVLTKDKRNKMHELINSREIKSFTYIASKYLAVSILTMICYVIPATHATYKFIEFASVNNYSIDPLAFYKYSFTWIAPTVLFTTALGMMISAAIGNGIAAVAVQAVLWFTSLLPLSGDYGLTKILIRFNTAGEYNNYMAWRSDIIINRIFFTLLSMGLLSLTTAIWAWKRGAGFGQFKKHTKPVEV